MDYAVVKDRAQQELDTYLDAVEPELEKNIVEYWMLRANDLSLDSLSSVMLTGLLSVFDRQQVRQDVAGFLLDVLLPAWTDAYASAGGTDHARYVQARVQALQESWTRDTILALESAGSILASTHGEGADAGMLAALYGLTSTEALQVARFDGGLSKGLANRAYQYARQLLAQRARRIATYEPAHARDAGEEEKARKLYGFYGYINVWRVDPTSDVCERCARMEGEEAEPGQLFSEGVASAPLHPECRCRTERKARTL